MKPFENEQCLALIRLLPCCWCGAAPPSEAAHLYTKGFGGAMRFDAPFNLAPLCRACHQSQHTCNAFPSTEWLIKQVAKREQMTEAWLKDRMWLFLRSPKDCAVCAACMGRGSLPSYTFIRKTWHSTPCTRCQGAGVLTAIGEPYLEIA